MAVHPEVHQISPNNDKMKRKDRSKIEFEHIFLITFGLLGDDLMEIF